MPIDWGDGSYERTARDLECAAERAVACARIAAGERVLDVGCGTGNAALAAARRGAVVTGVDPAVRLLEVARRRAAEVGLEIAFTEGEAAAPGVPDGAFDAAIAIFSVIFAPDAEAAVAGMVRAVRPGGRIVVTTWIAEGAICAASNVFGDAMRAGAGAGAPPSVWLEAAPIRALFEGHGAIVTITEEALVFEAASPEAWLDDLETHHPFGRAARVFFADRPAEYAALRARALEALHAGNETTEGFRCTSRYRVVRADLPGA
jgi:SAM-dependent methyltransferase